MPLASSLMGLGNPAESAKRLGFSGLSAVTAAGTTTDNATVLKKEQNNVNLTATGADGVKLPADAEYMQPYALYNNSGSTGIVYPTSGGTINGGTSLSLADNKFAICYRLSSTIWAATLTA